MKKIASIAILLFASVLMLTACNTESGKKDSAPKKISVVATIYPQYDWLKNVIGERADAVDLKLLIKNGTDLHSYKPSAKDIATIAKADLVVYVGGESDEWIEKALEATPKEGRIALNLMKALGDRIKEEEVVEGMQVEEHHHEHGEEAEEHEHEHHEHAEKHEDEHHHHEEVENDEHIWLSLVAAKYLVGVDIVKALVKIDTANAETYRSNAADYTVKLNEIDDEYADAVAEATHETILFGDRFPFRYLVDDYGIKYYAAFAGCSAESEASFETVTFLANKMDSLALPAILTIDGSDGRIARAILEASKNSKNAQVLTLNSMQSVTDEQIKAGVDYLSIMRDNLEVLKKALK
ncbi:metal ABC transporter substrate-binding protein [Fibrobacter sp. UBA3629]|uniref:metal ABC transporter substrate-binding protein n=1 Tax=Fibrobacter sp. UBA3629 TaxID=1946530 RepID=UPI0025BF1F7B|nr:metal ABC transporter substrate-binding protein [Fibrobacter sp. UBA3629]